MKFVDLTNEAEVGDYPDAGKDAPEETKGAMEDWGKQPEKVKQNTPLLYWLLGSGTPEYWYLCSQLRGEILPRGWCKLWKKGLVN